MSLHEHVPHPRIAARAETGPIRTADQHTDGVNGRIARWVCDRVGTIGCAYLFSGVAVVSLPAALATGSVIVIVGWAAQTFLQLVLLAVLQLGGNLAAAAADRRAEATWADAEAILHGQDQTARHLTAQDALLTAIHARVTGSDAAGVTP